VKLKKMIREFLISIMVVMNFYAIIVFLFLI